jgi:DnaJ-class molecular chaperone
MHVKCPRCDGTGKHNGFDCALCGGKGHEEEKVVQAYRRREGAPYWSQDDHRREEE